MSDYKTLVVDGTAYETTLTRNYLRRKPYRPRDPKRLAAFIPGVIRAVKAEAGCRVVRGQSLLVLEAMKMENDLVAPADAVVKAIYVSPGDTVTKGQLLVEFE